MVEPDTIRLLRECDAGIKMGVSAISDVVDRVADKRFRRLLTDCKAQHDKLKAEIRTLLDKYGDDGKDPNPIAKGMSHMKTGMKLGMDDSDETIAGLMTDGCNMGGQVPEPVPESVQGGGRDLQGHHQAAHRAGGAAGGGYQRIFIRIT